jgi:hypothetical protein
MTIELNTEEVKRVIKQAVAAAALENASLRERLIVQQRLVEILSAELVRVMGELADAKKESPCT